MDETNTTPISEVQGTPQTTPKPTPSQPVPPQTAPEPKPEKPQDYATAILAAVEAATSKKEKTVVRSMAEQFGLTDEEAQAALNDAKSYCNATGAPIGVWTNGEQISCYNRKDPNFFEAITDIPKVSQKLSDIMNEQYSYNDLIKNDKISNEKRALRALIKEMEDEVLASAGVDSFEEIFKLIFTKLYDELICAHDMKCTPCQVQNLLSGSSSATSCDIMPSLCR